MYIEPEISTYKVFMSKKKHGSTHGLRTRNEGINQRYLKNWADVADKICFDRTLLIIIVTL